MRTRQENDYRYFFLRKMYRHIKFTEYIIIAPLRRAQKEVNFNYIGHITCLSSLFFITFLAQVLGLVSLHCFQIQCLMFLFFLVSFLFFIDHIKKKNRRRPSWGRGIIRKKKSYKKGTGEEEEPEAEVEVTGPSDSCLTQDEESSCDTSGPQTNGHLPSTEEESSNEPPDAAEAQTLNADEQLQELASKEESVSKECEDSETPRQLHCLDDDSQAEVKGDNQEKQADPQSLTELSEAQKHTDSFLVSQMDCVNGSESMDSMDSQTLKGSSEAVKSTSHSEGSKNTPELDEHNATNKREATQEHRPQDMIETTENTEEGQDKEGIKFKNPAT